MSLRIIKVFNVISQKDRINVFNKTADLLCNKYREQMLAYTILGQKKFI